ncbi:Protein HGH1 [Orchesella cincta]|uniref:Protein HGH1 n=1 Tax=Orchesella cincta TaxID=48709 RepID=A0A1D2MS59_ORCCI|nr:Protein HGH1 [Orchesella cincta]
MATQQLQTVAPFQDSSDEVEEIEGMECVCDNCNSYKADGGAEQAFDTTKHPITFPKMSFETQKEGEPSISFAGLAKCFGTDPNLMQDPNEPGRINLTEVDFSSIIKIFTYLSPEKDGDSMEQLLPELIKICDLLLLVKLDRYIGDNQIRQDFIRKACMLFVMSWHAKLNGLTGTEWCCWQTRRFLSYILTFPTLAAEAKLVLLNDELWPDIGPIQIFERLCNDCLYCAETLTLFCNLTRINGMAEELESKSKFVNIVKDQFYGYCRKLDSNIDGLGGLLMHLLVNLSRIKGLSEFMITANHNYFMHPVLLNVLNAAETSNTTAKAVWPFLKNLALTDAGRNALLEQLGVFLGPILYPIAGPEVIDEDESKKMPPEVQYLPEDKTRVEDKKVRDCILHILFALCRYRVGREKLREFNVYQVLKHYHLWEEDKELEEKLESLVNILIREEETEIPFDDLMDGLNIDK